AARVGYNDTDGYILNPSYSVLEKSALDMVVAGTESAVLMVESEAKELSEDLMLGAVLFAHVEMQAVVKAVKELQEMAGKPAWEWAPVVKNAQLQDAMMAACKDDITAAYQVSDKMARHDALGKALEKAVAQFANDSAEPAVRAADVQGMFSSLEKKIVR